jgi:hypothetical protein
MWPMATDVLGVSGRAILARLADGERDPQKLAELARSRFRGKRDELTAALEGCLQKHGAFWCGRCCRI